jgi:hypothetical protein
MPFHLLETYISNPSLFFISFFTLPPKGNTDGNHNPRAYMRGEVSFANFLFFSKLICQTEQLEQFVISIWHLSNFGKTTKISL